MKRFTRVLSEYSRKHPVIPATMMVLASIFLLVPIVFVYSGRKYVYAAPEDIEPTTYAIVFGAGVTENGTPSTALRDRLMTAQKLYEKGIIRKIIISGDNSEKNHYETDVMQTYLLNHNIPQGSIIIDPDGTRTYETCRNAKDDLEIDEALLISQGFHLPRAIFLCNALGVESSGFSATQRDYLYGNIFKIREVFAIYRSLLDIYVIDPAT
jgi:SanA protein